MTSRTITFVGYGVILGLVIVWAAVAARRATWMSLPDAMSAVTRKRAVRVVVVVGWIWLGWHLFARGSGAFK